MSLLLNMQHDAKMHILLPCKPLSFMIKISRKSASIHVLLNSTPENVLHVLSTCLVFVQLIQTYIQSGGINLTTKKTIAFKMGRKSVEQGHCYIACCYNYQPVRWQK